MHKKRQKMFIVILATKYERTKSSMSSAGMWDGRRTSRSISWLSPSTELRSLGGSSGFGSCGIEMARDPPVK